MIPSDSHLISETQKKEKKILIFSITSYRKAGHYCTGQSNAQEIEHCHQLMADCNKLWLGSNAMIRLQ